MEICEVEKKMCWKKSRGVWYFKNLVARHPIYQIGGG